MKSWKNRHDILILISLEPQIAGSVKKPKPKGTEDEENVDVCSIVAVVVDWPGLAGLIAGRYDIHKGGRLSKAPAATGCLQP